jgi:hypothetical protein
MPEELQEIEEHAEEARHDPTLKPVSLTMAVLAVLLAVVTLLGHRAHTESVLLQARASDQWAYYQAKGTRRHTYEMFADLMSTITSKDPAKADQARGKYIEQARAYRDEQQEIQDKAQEFEQEARLAERKANRFNLGEVFLEIALVITSITLLSSNRSYWMMGLVFAAIGVVLAATGFLVH